MRETAASIILIFFFLSSAVFASETLKEGAPPPMFVMLDENNRNIDIASFMDRPTIMYFTHNSCFYCTQIVLYLKRAEKKFGKEHLRIIGVNIMAKDQKLIRAYKEALGFTFPMFAGNRDDVLRAYRINYVPLIIFVDSKNIVRKVVGHYIHEKELFENIQGIMK